MVPLLFWRMQCLKSQHSFLWIGNNDVLGFATGGDEQILTLLQVAGVGFDATYDLLVNTLTSEVKEL
jgi:hypothetical protein